MKLFPWRRKVRAHIDAGTNFLRLSLVARGMNDFTSSWNAIGADVDPGNPNPGKRSAGGQCDE